MERDHLESATSREGTFAEAGGKVMDFVKSNVAFVLIGASVGYAFYEVLEASKPLAITTGILAGLATKMAWGNRHQYRLHNESP